MSSMLRSESKRSSGDKVMAITWQEIKKTPDYTLELNLLEEIRDNLSEGRKVRIGTSILDKKDIKDVQTLIDKELQKNGVK